VAHLLLPPTSHPYPKSLAMLLFLVNPYNTKEITAAMQAIAADSKLRSHMITLGINRANTFSWTKTGIATVEVLSQYL
jgi:hypothetical protein